MTPTIDDYLAGVPDDVRATLQGLRRTITAAAPDAVESFAHGMPAYAYRGKWLVGFGAFKRHCSLFPGTLKFTADAPLPDEVVERLVRSRMQDVDTQLG